MAIKRSSQGGKKMRKLIAFFFLLLALLFANATNAEEHSSVFSQKSLLKELKIFSLNNEAYGEFTRQFYSRVTGESRVLFDLFTLLYPEKLMILSDGDKEGFLREMVFFAAVFINIDEPILWQLDDVCRKVEMLKAQLRLNSAIP